MGKEIQKEAFERLLSIMDRLREECPWDRKQTFDSLKKNTIEETFELIEAIDEKHYSQIREELGDLLLHVVFYAKLGEEIKEFDITDVANGISDKLIARHPHIFGDVKAETAEEVLENWEKLKLKEKKGKKVLSGVPKALPAMIKAMRVQEKVRGVGFDWDKREQVWDKVKEEIAELEHELKAHDTAKIENEFGDVFFSLINAARLYDVDPEDALQKTVKKFIRRFNYLEQETIAKGQSLKEMSLDEMNEIWEQAKQFDENK